MSEHPPESREDIAASLLAAFDAVAAGLTLHPNGLAETVQLADTIARQLHDRQVEASAELVERESGCGGQVVDVAGELSHMTTYKFGRGADKEARTTLASALHRCGRATPDLVEQYALDAT